MYVVTNEDHQVRTTKVTQDVANNHSLDVNRKCTCTPRYGVMLQWIFAFCYLCFVFVYSLVFVVVKLNDFFSSKNYAVDFWHTSYDQSLRWIFRDATVGLKAKDPLLCLLRNFFNYKISLPKIYASKIYIINKKYNCITVYILPYYIQFM